ncbi:MAG: hypothetical protein WC599_03090 [Bacteroidales bacterium]
MSIQENLKQVLLYGRWEILSQTSGNISVMEEYLPALPLQEIFIQKK